MVEVKRGPKRLIKGPQVADTVSAVETIALSSSDLVVPRVHVEVIYAFEAPAPPAELLEKGLAETLLEYREWAGRLSKDVDGRPVIALNGQGPAWIDAVADVPLVSMMPFNPGWNLLEFVPPNRSAEELLMVQVTKFSCGGITLGIARHHQIADGEAASGFMDAWVAAVKGLTPLGSPIHDRSILMARDPPQPKFEHVEYKKPPPKPETEPPVEYPPLSIKKFHFSTETLKKLKEEAMKDLNGQGFYTTFESLTAYLWKNISKARGLSGETATKAMVAVNGRRKLKPPVADNYFGNVIFHACCQASVKDLIEQPLSYATAVVQKAVRRLDDEYMRSALDFVELRQKHPVPVARAYRTILSPNLSVTSWVNLPLYKLDFGYGTPLFAGPPLIPFEGLVMLLPSYTKDGSIDVSLGLLAPDMAKFESLL
ncbi:unnamed protein product [Calypogeia fissa]